MLEQPPKYISDSNATVLTEISLKRLVVEERTSSPMPGRRRRRRAALTCVDASQIARLIKKPTPPPPSPPPSDYWQPSVASRRPGRITATPGRPGGGQPTGGGRSGQARSNGHGLPATSDPAKMTSQSSTFVGSVLTTSVDTRFDDRTDHHRA